MPFDFSFFPIYRVLGKEPSIMPGVIKFDVPVNAARGREQDRLLVYLALTGNATITESEYQLLTKNVAKVFYQTPRAVTSALRAAADSLNTKLIERNMKTSGKGEYALAWLILFALRENFCIFSVCGPMHVYKIGESDQNHFFEPSISGKGLGSSQNLNIHYAQTELSVGDLMLFCGRLPNEWETVLNKKKLPKFISKNYLTSLTHADLNAVLISIHNKELLDDNPFQRNNYDKSNISVQNIPRAKKESLKLFLCHASADKPTVRELYKRLSKEEWIEPWLDEEKLKLGQHWAVAIEQALDESDAVIIFLSRNSVKKEGFVQRELNHAWDISLEKPRDIIFLIPFRLDDCEVPRHLRSRQWGDYFGEEKEETYQRLLISLRERYQQKFDT